MIIIGDFNLHVDNNTDKHATYLSHLLEDLSFMQHVHEPTHSCGHTLDQGFSTGVRGPLVVRDDIAGGP